MQHGVTTPAVEIEVHAQRVSVRTRLGAELHRHAARGHRAPGGRSLERVQDHRRRAKGRGGEQQERPNPSHPLTLPAITPRMYQRWSTTNSASTGSTVTTAPAIINS